jgi:hypothetical protein
MSTDGPQPTQGAPKKKKKKERKGKSVVFWDGFFVPCFFCFFFGGPLRFALCSKTAALCVVNGVVPCAELAFGSGSGTVLGYRFSVQRIFLISLDQILDGPDNKPTEPTTCWGIADSAGG